MREILITGVYTDKLYSDAVQLFEHCSLYLDLYWTGVSSPLLRPDFNIIPNYVERITFRTLRTVIIAVLAS